MNLERVSSSTEGTGNNLYVNLASDCRVKGVESNKSQGSHCRISLSTHVSVTGSYFHHAFVYDGTGTKGYGVTLIQHAGMCLVTNNIFRILRHAMMTKQGANGNVFGYNYSREVYRTEFPQNFGGDISLHGHYSFANLFEGNIVQTIHVDDYWGPSGPCNTFFRNRAELYGILMTTSGTDTSNFAGNEILNVYPYGNYTITGNGNFLYGNNRNGSIQPPGTDTLPDSSYHFKSIPPFWNITDAWPGIGPPNALNSHSIPAKARYLSGRFTDCSGGSLVPVNRRLPDELRVYPDPAGEFLFVDLPGTGPYCMDIFSSSGQHILYRKLRDDTYVGISSLSPGLYIVRVQQGVRIMARKFLMP
jgi:hypothetical protein